MGSGLKILVLGEDTRSFLAVIRSLYNADHQVDVVCYDRNSPASRSKAIGRQYYFNHQANSPERWLEQVRELVLREAYDFVIPCDERAIFPLLSISSQFPSATTLCVTNQCAREQLFDKYLTKLCAQRCDVNVAPGELFPLSDCDYSTLAKRFAVPFVIKPLESYSEGRFASRNAVKVCHDETQFLAYQRHCQAGEQYLVEAFFAGKGEGVSLLAVAGEVKALFAHERVSEPESGGGSSYRVSIELDDELRQACEKICKATDYTGVGMFEFRRNQQTNEWILVEVNARFWGSLPLAVFAGVDFPALYIQALQGLLKGPCIDHYRVPVYARALSTDLYQIKADIETRFRSQGAMAALRFAATKSFELGRILQRRETIDTFSWRDPAPFAAELSAFYRDSVGRKLSAIFDSHQRRFHAANRLVERFRSNPQGRVVFVCYGNIMRSPFAACYFEQQTRLQGLSVEVDSSGFHPHEGRSSPEQAQQAARSFKVDLSQHRSKWLRQDSVRDEDLYIIFDFKNRDRANRFYQIPNLINAADLLPQKLGKYMEIEDPYGQSIYQTERCYYLIKQAVDTLVAGYQQLPSQSCRYAWN